MLPPCPSTMPRSQQAETGARRPCGEERLNRCHPWSSIEMPAPVSATTSDDRLGARRLALSRALVAAGARAPLDAIAGRRARQLGAAGVHCRSATTSDCLQRGHRGGLDAVLAGSAAA
jgi:hypothetical protein